MLLKVNLFGKTVGLHMVVSIVVIWSWPLGSLKILKRYIGIFKKESSLISFYFPFLWTIKLTKESSNDHISQTWGKSSKIFQRGFIIWLKRKTLTKKNNGERELSFVFKKYNRSSYLKAHSQVWHNFWQQKVL